MNPPTPLELLQTLLRFDTTNPPGNELACIQYIDDLLQTAGFTTKLIARDPNRPNLIAHLPGRGDAPPLLWQGHVDVVTVEGQQWTHPPFDAVIDDGLIWGRGTLDMKGAVAMMISAVLQAKAAGIVPAGDIILCILSDEESSANYGARFLVEEHPELFAGVKYGIGEFGGFNIELGGKKFYPIQIAEKRSLKFEASLQGAGGHASGIFRGGIMAQTADLLTQLDQWRLPVIVTPAVRLMLNAVADQLPFPNGPIIRGLLNPALTNSMLKLMGEQGASLEPLLRHTINATIINGGVKQNVIPSKIDLQFDVRLLPGLSTQSFLDIVQAGLKTTAKFVVLDEGPIAPEPNMGLFDTLAGILHEADPDGTPIPFVLQAVTDARFFAKLGIQTYGFIPMQLPDGFNPASMVHAADERIPVGAVDFGTAAMVELIKRYQG